MTDEPGATNTPEMIAGVAELHPELAFDFAMAHMAAINERVDVVVAQRLLSVARRRHRTIRR